MTAASDRSVFKFFAILALALGALWTAFGLGAVAPQIGGHLANSTSPTAGEIELLPEGVIVDPAISLELASTLAIVNHRHSIDVDYSTSHGVEKHKHEALNVRKCIENGGHSVTLISDRNDHRLRLCQVDPTTVGLQVVARIGGKWKEITAYYISTNSNVREVTLDLIDAGHVIRWALREVLETLP